METIKIRGREYSVEKGERNGSAAYTIKGPRGAHYVTMRNKPHPDRMFLIDYRGFGIASVMKGVWLSDKDGTLKVQEQ